MLLVQGRRRLQRRRRFLSSVAIVLALFSRLVTHVTTVDAITLEASSDRMILDREFMNFTEIAVELEAMLTVDIKYVPTDLDQYEYIKEYSDAADSAILARKFGYCFVVFPETDVYTNKLDVVQSFIPGFHDVCPNTAASSYNTNCGCWSRTGFVWGYNTKYRWQLEKDIRTCVDNCVDKDKCLFLAGHSQGGSIARVAAIYLYSYNPIVITTANFRTINAGCQELNATRWVRFVNTGHNKLKGLYYDFWPIFFHVDFKLYNHGVTYFLTDDSTGVADIGINGYEHLPFLDPSEPHRLLSGAGNGYLDRIKAIVARNDTYYPVRTNGYSRGFYCTRNTECVSSKCTSVGIFPPWIKKCE